MASSRAAIRRLGQDYQALQQNPCVGAAAAPTEGNIFVWHMNFHVEITLNSTKHLVPLHAILEAPKDYPQNPPNVGFCTRFPYTMGASYIERKDGPLKNTLVLCLNILGNFANIHTEWQAKEGEGWSPSMSVETCIVNLQALLSELDGNLNVSQKQSFIKDCKKFELQIPEMNITHTYDEPWPPIATREQAEQMKQETQFMKKIARIPSPEIQERVESFFRLIPGQNTKKKYCDIIIDMMELYENNMMGMSEAPQTFENDEIKCYVLQTSYQEELLGYGVVQDRKQLKTPGELLCQSAFDQEGVRFSATKKSFTHWLPAFINQTHISHGTWYSETKKRLDILAKLIQQNNQQYGNSKPVHPILEILPNLINSMIVEIMKGDKASAISYFEALCSFWRTLRFFLFESPEAETLRGQAMKKMQSFCTTEDGRHKQNVPDVGQFLALYTCLTDKVRESTFVDAYQTESSTRSVMWWKDDIQPQARAVFEKTKIGRGIFMFQMTVCRQLLNGNPVQTCEDMDRSCGKMPERLEALQKKWREVEPNIKTWKQFFEYAGCSESYSKPKLNNLDNWCRWLITEADRKGPRYQKRRRNNNRHGGKNRSYQNRNNNNRRGGGRGRRRQNYI